MQFDYIIVGAGSAGCVLAERLSADGHSSVLLIEAGAHHWSPYIDMPRGWAKMWKNPKYFWNFLVEPEPGRPQNETWSYGKGLGGSSAVNGTMYFCGQPRDYDGWEAAGNTGWNWREMARCFQAIEHYHGPSENPLRGRSGPVDITRIVDHSPIIEAVLTAGEELHLPRLDDLNGPSRLGIGYTQTTVDTRGHRVSAYTAFLRPALRRKNLHVRTDTTVTRVNFEDRRARGVTCLGPSGICTFEASGEVIICAGVLQSPKLLQLSGIGPHDLLNKHGISVVVDCAAVGKNMAEHIMFSHVVRLRGVTGINREFRNWRLWMNVARYYIARSGVMSYATAEVTALAASEENRRDWPDLQLCFSPYSFDMVNGAQPEPGRGRTELQPGLSVTILVLRPTSRGVVEIQSCDCADSPRIRANWLSTPADETAATSGVKLAREFMRTPALRNFTGEELIPGRAVQSDPEILNYLRAGLSSGLHGTGTCRMGVEENAVVDPNLRVRGVTGLRVADCSVMPSSISGNTNGPAMALAYKASEIILGDRCH